MQEPDCRAKVKHFRVRTGCSKEAGPGWGYGSVVGLMPSICTPGSVPSTCQNKQNKQMQVRGHQGMGRDSEGTWTFSEVMRKFCK